MRTVLMAGAALAAMSVFEGARAADAGAPNKTPTCTGVVDPYKNYACLDTYLGTTFWERFFNYYRLEWGHDGAPADPKAPPSRRAEWPATPQSIPPYPFTEIGRASCR